MSEYIFKLPDLGEGTVESEIGEWHIAVGDQVAEEDIVGTMMTDKAAIELSSPVTGKVLSLAGEPGDTVAVGSPLIVFETEEAGDEPPAAAGQPAKNGNGRQERTAKADTSAAATDKPKADDTTDRVMTSPAIRRRARESGIDLRQVSGSGTGGRIVRADLDNYIAKHAAGAPSRQQQERPVARDEEVKVIGLRRIIAERMSTAKREIPHFSYVEEIDITELEALRQHLNARADRKSERLTLLPFIGLALIRALQEFPQCNATYNKVRNALTRHGAVHLGIATQTADGLKVPVLRNSQQCSLHELSAEIRRVSDAARDNSIKREELTGSTITLTSLGKLGGIVTTPVVNLPEVAIVGVNRAVERPVVRDGQIAIRLMMNLSSSFDHRFVDGADAAAMIQAIRDLLEHPATLFI